MVIVPALCWTCKLTTTAIDNVSELVLFGACLKTRRKRKENVGVIEWLDTENVV